MRSLRNLFNSKPTLKVILLTLIILIIALVRILVKTRYICSLNLNLEESYTMLYTNNTEIYDDSTYLDASPIWAPNFQFIINNENLCKHKNIYLLIAVHSSVSNILNRAHIRELLHRAKKTTNIKVKVVFMVAQTIIPEVQTEISKEASQYKDIVQGSYVDNYKTMTYKHLSTIKWVNHYCSHTKYILKLDDDVFLNMLHIKQYISNLNKSMNNQICCKVYKHALVIRKGKNAVTNKEYADKYYPNFCQGMAYITTPIVYKKLYQAAIESDFLWLDDVYVTGILKEKCNVTLIDFSKHSKYFQKRIKHDQIAIENLMFVSASQDMMDNWSLWMDRIESLNK